MTSLRQTAIAIACAGACFAAPLLHATDNANITVYRSDSAALYASNGDGGDSDGYAVVREKRALNLKSGVQDVVLGDLPVQLDAESLALGFPNNSAKVISQRLLLGQGPNAALTGMVGRTITVLGADGATLASGTLLRAGSDGLVVRNGGATRLIRTYAAVQVNEGDFPSGSSLRVRLDAAHAGPVTASLSYPTSGLGWRAAYVGTLQPGNACRLQFESRASIANRSGSTWQNAQLTLIAGEPNFAKESAPRPMVAMARNFSAKAESADMPQQATLADYRSYTLPTAVDLPNGSISQVPLYATRTLDCERTALYENGNSWQPAQPMLSSNFDQSSSNAVFSTLKLKAFDSLPAGYLRVLTIDKDGTAQFIGEGRINDTPKGSDASMTLGTAFDLRAERTRTHFSVDKAGRVLDEAFRIELSNASDSARIITVREHPNRWREWTLASSSSKPSLQSADTLEFRVNVPANGKATLDYAVRYHWTADEHPQ
ncbi:MAG: DUF4139 domain-containing protein [Rhodanobacter sp.]